MEQNGKSKRGKVGGAVVRVVIVVGIAVIAFFLGRESVFWQIRRGFEDTAHDMKRSGAADQLKESQRDVEQAEKELEEAKRMLEEGN